MGPLNRSSIVSVIAFSLLVVSAALSGCEDGKKALVTEEDTALADITMPDVVNTAPTLIVDLPEDGVVVRVGDPVPFQLTYSDIEDGPKGKVSYEKIPGEVSADQETDENGIIAGEITGLEPGKQVLTFIAIDSAGLQTEASVTVLINTAPGAPVVAIEPANPDTTDDLVATVIEAPEDPDRASSELAYSYKWSYFEVLLDGAQNELIETDITGDTVPSTKTERGQLWRVEVRANDGTDEGTLAEAEITIGNAPPTKPEVGIEPFDANITSKLTCTATATDPDGGTPSLSYTWFINGNPVEDSDTDVLDLTADLTILDAETGEVIKTMTLRETLYSFFQLKDGHSLFAEIHSRASGGVDVVIPERNVVIAATVVCITDTRYG